MDENEDLSSDTSDDDYVPGEESDEEAVSECREDSADDQDGTSTKRATKSSSTKRKKHGTGLSPRKKLPGGIKLDDDDDELPKDKSLDEEDEEDRRIKAVDEDAPAAAETDEECNKKRADDLWSSFKKDVETTTTTATGIKPKSSDDEPSSTTLPTSSPRLAGLLKNSERVTVTEVVYDFAGEEVRVTEQLKPGSNRHVKHVVLQPDSSTTNVCATPTEPSPGGTKKPAGLGNILNKLGGKKKLSTLEKSRLDWNQFKNQEGIEEELTTFNRGKEGYLEKQAFLQRADVRQFEIERSLRMTNRSNR